jgi:hypothetical protein
MNRSKTKYSDLLKLPEWQKKRLEILQRDSFRCVRCNNARISLHVHHKFYQKGKSPWDYPDYNFETLCEVCHATAHLPEQTPVDNENKHMHRMTGELGRITRLIEEKKEAMGLEPDIDKQMDLMAEIKDLFEQKKKAFKENL